MSIYDFEIGHNLYKEFSMFALVNLKGKCPRFDRLENIQECVGSESSIPNHT